MESPGLDWRNPIRENLSALPVALGRSLVVSTTEKALSLVPIGRLCRDRMFVKGSVFFPSFSAPLFCLPVQLCLSTFC